VARSLSSQGLVDDLELSVDELAGERELDSHGRAGRPGGGCHVSRRKVERVAHTLGTMLRQITQVDDGGDGGGHGEDNGGGGKDEEHAEVEGGESVSGGRLETVREQGETLADEPDRRSLSRFEGGSDNQGGDQSAWNSEPAASEEGKGKTAQAIKQHASELPAWQPGLA
jgi:hypothetical protein